MNWPRASVAYFCVHHAAELFLKACVLRRAPPGEKLHHDVSKLQRRYCELYPEIQEEFHIETPWDIGLRDVEEAVGLSLDLEPFEYAPDQVYRYMTGKDAATAKMRGSFAPGM